MFFVCFIVPVVISLVDTPNFLLWNAIKGFMGGMNLLVAMINVHMSIGKIVGALGNLPEDKQKALKAKFAKCERVGFTIAALLIISSVGDALEPEFQFTIIPDMGGFFIWMVFRFVFLIGFSVYYTTNKIPDKRKTGSGTTIVTTSKTSASVAPEG